MIVAVTYSGRALGYAIRHKGLLAQAGYGDWYDVCSVVQDFLSTTSTPPQVIAQKAYGSPLESLIVGSLMWLAHAHGAEFRELWTPFAELYVNQQEAAIAMLERYAAETHVE